LRFRERLKLSKTLRDREGDREREVKAARHKKRETKAGRQR
jgi:hypothetical protein